MKLLLVLVLLLPSCDVLSKDKEPECAKVLDGSSILDCWKPPKKRPAKHQRWRCDNTGAIIQMRTAEMNKTKEMYCWCTNPVKRRSRICA